MKKFLFSIVLLGTISLASLLVYDRINLNWMIRTMPSEIEKMERLFGEVKTERVAIFGSSRASSHYIPEFIDNDAYNYGLSGSAMNETLFLIRQRLKHFKEGIIIINLDPSSFNKGWDDIKQCPFRGEYRLVGLRPSVFSCLPKGVVSLDDVIPGVRFWGELRPKLARDKNVPIEHIQGAQVVDEVLEECVWEERCAHASAFEFQIGPEVQPVLDELYRIASPGVRFVWVASPLAPCYDTKAKGLDGMLEFMKRQAEYSTVSYLTFLNTLPRYDRLECKDPYHLNKAGAIRFSKELREHLSLLRQK